MSRDGVVRHHLDRLTEEDLPGAIRCSDSEVGSLGRMPKFRDGGCRSEPNRRQLWRAVIARQHEAAVSQFGFCRLIRVNARAPASGASPCPTGTQTCLLSRSGRTPKIPVHIRRSRFDKLPPASASLGLRHPYSWMNMTFSSPGTAGWRLPDR